jgi:integrase
MQSTINTHNSALNRVLDEALQRGWITESIKPTLLNKGTKSESRGAFTQEEYKLIYSNLAAWAQEGHRKKTREIREVLRDYVLFLSNTGVRHGTETEALRWKNVSWYIDKSPTGSADKKPAKKSQKYLQIDIVKGKTGKRTIIARDMMAIYLERLLQLNPNIKQKTLNTVIKAKLDEPLFVTRSGLHVSTDALRASFKQYLIKLNLRVGADNKIRSLYSLRHTYATLALLNGRSIHQLAVQMGNSTAIIEQYYSKLSAQLNASEHSGRKQFDTAFAIDQLDEK